MSDKSMLNEFLNRKPESAASKVLNLPRQESSIIEDEESESVERRAFGIGRGRRLPLMLDVRTMDEQRLALSYSHFVKVAFDPSGIIALEFTSQVLHIEGRNLEPIYENLVMQRVTYIQEENLDLEQSVDAKETFISRVHIGKDDGQYKLL